MRDKLSMFRLNAHAQWQDKKMKEEIQRSINCFLHFSFSDFMLLNAATRSDNECTFSMD